MNQPTDHDYLLGDDHDEMHRLQMQHQTWQPETVDLWDRAGFRSGQTIDDVGCGTGLTTLELAERVGPQGRVVAIDGSMRFVEVVRADVRALDLPAASADAAFLRWVLCFLDDPQTALKGIARVLKPGGLLVVMDYYNYEAFVDQPGSENFRQVFRAVYESFSRGLDIGGQVPQMMAACGLDVVETMEIGGVASPGDRIWNWVADFQRIYLPELVKKGLLAEETRRAHLAEWREREEDPAAHFVAPTMVGVIGARS